MTILARPESVELSGGTMSQLAVVVVGSLGSRTRSRSRIVMPGVTTRNASAEARVLRVGELVERLPGDEHRHDDRLARRRSPS